MYEDVAFVPGREYRESCKENKQDFAFPSMVLLAGYLKSKLALRPDRTEPSQEWIQERYTKPEFASLPDQALYKTITDQFTTSPNLKKDQPVLLQPSVLESRISPVGFMNALAKQFFDAKKGGALNDAWAVIDTFLAGNNCAILKVQLEDRYPKLSDYSEKAAMLASYLIVRESQPGNMNVAEGLPNLGTLLDHPSLATLKKDCESLLSGIGHTNDVVSSLERCYI